jgi:hypothetical protein
MFIRPQPYTCLGIECVPPNGTRANHDSMSRPSTETRTDCTPYHESAPKITDFTGVPYDAYTLRCDGTCPPLKCIHNADDGSMMSRGSTKRCPRRRPKRRADVPELQSDSGPQRIKNVATRSPSRHSSRSESTFTLGNSCRAAWPTPVHHPSRRRHSTRGPRMPRTKASPCRRG